MNVYILLGIDPSIHMIGLIDYCISKEKLILISEIAIQESFKEYVIYDLHTPIEEVLTWFAKYDIDADEAKRIIDKITDGLKSKDSIYIVIGIVNGIVSLITYANLSEELSFNRNKYDDYLILDTNIQSRNEMDRIIGWFSKHSIDTEECKEILIQILQDVMSKLMSKM